MTVYIGIDWRQAQRDVCFLDEADKAPAFQSASHLAVASDARAGRRLLAE